MSGARTVDREHGTRARYALGPRGSYRPGAGCRCEACTEANRAYARFENKRTRLQRDHGAWAMPFVDAGPARDHIEGLRRQGVGVRQVAHLAAQHRSVIAEIVSGRTRRIRRTTETAILSVTVPLLADGARLPARPTRVLVDRMVRHGVTRKRIGQAVTGNPAAVSLQLGKTWVTARAARRVEELHWEILGDPTNPDQPDRTRYPLEPLLAALDARQIPHKWLRQPGIEIHTTRAGRDGLNAGQADRAATALGIHPTDLWVEWDRHEEAA